LFMSATQLNPHYFLFDLVTSAGDLPDFVGIVSTVTVIISGTYVKEFVHGDMSRTVPSVSSLLGCQVRTL
jgi:hypothetical protein